MSSRLPTPGKPLTARELQILEGMRRALGNQEIGVELGLAEDTVKNHARRLFAKLGARDRTHAVALGFESGALRPAVPVDVVEVPRKALALLVAVAEKVNGGVPSWQIRELSRAALAAVRPGGAL